MQLKRSWPAMAVLVLALIALGVTSWIAVVPGKNADQQLLERICAEPAGPPSAEIFMAVDATESQIDGVRQYLDTSRLVSSFRYFDRAAAYEEFKRIFATDPDLVEGITPEALPTSFRARLAEPDAPQHIDEALSALPGVDDVAVPGPLGSPAICE